MLLTIRPTTGKVAEEGLVDVIVEEEEKEDSVELVVAFRVTR